MAFGKVVPVTQLNFGYPGAESRLGLSTTVSRMVRATLPNAIKFGDPVVIIPGADDVCGIPDLVGAGAGQLDTPFVAALFAGIAARTVRTSLINNPAYPYSQDGGAQGGYLPGERITFAEQGTRTVKVNVGQPASQGLVYIRVAHSDAVPAGIVGGFEAEDDGENTVLLTNVRWRTGQLDANGCAELTMLVRVAA